MADNRMDKYLQDLYNAEFGNTELDIDADDKEYRKLLKRCLNWKSYNNLYLVCEYLGAETDNRTDNIAGCKEIIKENLEM